MCTEVAYRPARVALAKRAFQEVDAFYFIWYFSYCGLPSSGLSGAGNDITPAELLTLEVIE